jgi:hypothetical protein
MKYENVLKKFHHSRTNPHEQLLPSSLSLSMLLLVILKWPLIKSKCMLYVHFILYTIRFGCNNGGKRKITSITPFIIRRFCVVFLITYSLHMHNFIASTQQYRKFILDCASIVVCRTIKRRNIKKLYHKCKNKSIQEPFIC